MGSRLFRLSLLAAAALGLGACTQPPPAASSASAGATATSSAASDSRAGAMPITGTDSTAGMSFFVTSTGSGKGADLGGLHGADKHCQTLAASVGAGKAEWHAYLSTNAAGGKAAENARERIGRGPWRNAKGVVIARSVDDLHSDANNLNKETALTEKGEVVNGSGDTPVMHDMLTGSTADGRAMDATCNNWTSSSSDGSAMLGHHDRKGTSPPPSNTSWNSAHPSRGCSQDALKSTGGAGLFYCFAVN
jgi:hypothetical protein